MSSKNKRKMQALGYPTTLEDLQKHKQALAIHEIKLIEKSLTSNNPNDIIEAQNHIKQGSRPKQQVDMKSFMFAPEHEFYSGMGFKNKLTSISYLLLRQMARTPQINAIIQTRVDQAMNFSQFVTDEQKPGWTIRKRLGHFANEEERELSDLDKREIDAIVNWMESGGRDVDEWEREDMASFFKKVYRDSWEIDQAAFEVSWLRKGIPYQYQSVDGGTIRLAETFDDREYQEAKSSGKYMPKYVQVWKNLVHNEYYPMELCLGMRNTASDVMLNGYGVSELEILIQIVTWMLYGMQYNGNFFQQGSNPKGILNFKQNIDPIKLEEFKQGWRNTLTGIGNSHKMAVTAGADLEWIAMQQTNKDMEFHQWNDFMTILSCTVFRIDPDEVGFHLQGTKGIFGQDGQKQRLDHSKQKGLEPFLRYWQSQFDQYLVKPLSRGKYEFIFTGLTPVDEDKALEKDIKLVAAGGISLQDFFLKYSGRKLNEKKDIILNQIYLSYKQMNQMGGQESNQAVDQMTGEEQNPYAQFEEENIKKGEDPFAKAFINYLDNNLRKSE